MKELLFSFYFSPTEMQAGKLSSCIEILEQLQLVPELNHTVTGPGEDFETRRQEVKKSLISDRKSWIRSTIETGADFFISSDYADKNVYAKLTVSSSYTKFNEYPETTYVFNLRTNNKFDNGIIIRAIMELSNILGFYWGEVSPSETKTHLVNQIVRPHEKNRIPEFGLPVVKVPQFLSSPEIPFFIGWINYWSEETIRIIGFDDHEDGKLFYKTHVIINRGVIVQLCETPLDTNLPDHLGILKRVYDRYSKIGGRDTPFEYLK